VKERRGSELGAPRPDEEPVDRADAREETPEEAREASDETLIASLAWSDLGYGRAAPAAPSPATEDEEQLALESTADDGIPFVVSEPGPPSSLILETLRTPPPPPSSLLFSPASAAPSPRIGRGSSAEGRLDRTSAWGVPQRPSSLEAIGKVVAGRYLLGPVLGAGGMGTVFRAKHTDLGKQVAIKVLSATLDGEAEATARFLREAKAASTIESEHIAQVFDVGEDLHLGFYMVMELLKGEDLSRAIATRGALRPGVAAGIVWQVCLALERAHANGVVHRDLKPANVFLTRGDDDSVRVKVLDFGIAKLVHDARSRNLGITQSGIVIGTPHYMSPEQAQGLDTVDHRTDLYSLGALLFEAMTGRPPYPELETYEETLFKLLSEDPPRLASKVPGVPPELDALVRQLMARDPEKRPASAREVRTRLAAIFPSLGRRTLVLGGSAPSVPAATPRPPPPRRSHPARTGSGVTVDSAVRTSTVPVKKRRPSLILAGVALALTSLIGAFFVVRGPLSGDESEAAKAVSSAVEQAAAAIVPPEPAPAASVEEPRRLLAPEEGAARLVDEAQRALAEGNPSRARELAAGATRRSPASAEAWLTLGAALEALGDHPAARAAYERCKQEAAGDRARECAAQLAR
jgi:serine/threonine protein kinase